MKSVLWSNTPKVIPRIFGGIGNQLFIYAAARRLALVNNAELVLDNVSGFVHDYNYQRHYQLDHFHIPCRKTTAAERMEPFSRMRRYVKRHLNRYRSFEQSFYIQQQGRDFEPRLLQVKPQGTVYLEGYWQSEKYFKDVENIIRQELKIQSPTDDANLSMAVRIRTHIAVAVHVRFFDDGISNASRDYYKRAINRMEQIVPDAHYFLFSDRPKVARELIALPERRITSVEHNQGDEMAYADLWLMTLCQHFIIANSTFSWWGAWLSDQNGKQVVAPGFKLNDPRGTTGWNFSGQLPTCWYQV
ncbi:MAG: alpha-1,2-fucosyltransferase [Cyanobacteria bacterium P01_B01_bin.77]